MELFVKILTNVFGNATIILGLVALFGCLLLRRKWTDTLLAVIKTMMGYEIVSAGAGFMGTAMMKSTMVIAAEKPLQKVARYSRPSTGRLA